jgi:excisionase family DNA binding protein
VSNEKPVERLLTLADCREAAQVTRWTLWRWIQEEGLRAVKIGGVTRIRESDWQRFLEKHTGSNGEVQ